MSEKKGTESEYSRKFVAMAHLWKRTARQMENQKQNQNEPRVPDLNKV